MLFAYAINKGADQLCGDSTADQHLCFRCIDSTIPLLSKSKISSVYPSVVAAQPGLCQTWTSQKSCVQVSHNRFNCVSVV